MIAFALNAITHHRPVWEPSGAQRSSRWLNRGRLALLFASASFGRIDLDAPSLVCIPARRTSVSLSGARYPFVTKPRSHASPGAPRVLTPRAYCVAGGAFTAIEPSSDAPCRFPGTAASAPAARQLLHDARCRAPCRLTRSARIPRRCTGEDATPEHPGRLPSCLG